MSLSSDAVFTKTGTSLNYVSQQAECWLDDMAAFACCSFDRQLALVAEGKQRADDFCNCIDLSFNELLSTASNRLKKDDFIIFFDEGAVFNAIELKCNGIERNGTRSTARSRSRYGVSVLRIIITLWRIRDIKNLSVLVQQECKQYKAAAKPGEQVTATVKVTQNRRKLLSVDLKSPDVTFRSLLNATSDPIHSGAGNASIPSNFGLRPDAMRRLYDKLLGKSKQVRNVSPKIEAATPWLSECNYEALPAYKKMIASPADDNSQSTTDEIYGAAGNHASLFVPGQWTRDIALSGTMDHGKYKAAINQIRRKKVRIDTSTYVYQFDYGVLREIEHAIASGQSVIISGISGCGKSTAANQPTLGLTVFEIGNMIASGKTERHIYRLNQLSLMLKKVERTRGRKLLIIHEFCIDPEVLQKLYVFDQFVFVGDERQPGTVNNAEHLFQFISDIGGRRFTLPVIWRVVHPAALQTANYLAYGSRFAMFVRSGLTKGDPQFDVIETGNNPIVIAASMLQYASTKIAAGRSVMIAAASSQLIKALNSLLAHFDEIPDLLQCRHLSDIQGRESDVFVVDLHDVAEYVPKIEDALRFVIMMLGRARRTTCLALGDRNMTEDRSKALPVEVLYGTLLRYRVKIRNNRGLKRSEAALDLMNGICRLIEIDEETIAVMAMDDWNRAYCILVKNLNHHNAKMLKSAHCVISAPMFFENSSDLRHEVEILVRLTKCDFVIPKNTTFEWLENAMSEGKLNRT